MDSHKLTAGKSSLRQSGEGEVQMLLRGDISLSSGSVSPQRAVWQDEQLFVGLKIIIIESGELLCRFPQQAERHIKGPALCAVWSQDLAHQAVSTDLRAGTSPRRNIESTDRFAP